MVVAKFMNAAYKTASVTAHTNWNFLAAGLLTCVAVLVCTLPAHSSEVRMGVSATLLSHCAMQLSGANAASTRAGEASFSARCNTAATPRIHAASRAVPAVDDSSAPAFVSHARAQTALIKADDGDQRPAQYIQYTIEY